MKLRVRLLFALLMIINMGLLAQAPDWQWATQAGGDSHDFGYGIIIDDFGNIYTIGCFKETAIFGSHSLTSNGSRDIFVTKMDSNGNFIWVTQAGGYGLDIGYGITIDDAENIYVTGIFYGTIAFGSYTLTSYGECDIFIAKLNSEGNWLWATQAGGISDDIICKITSDEIGNTYVTGGFYCAMTFGSHTLTSNGYVNLFIAKMDSNGNWQWVVQLDEGTNLIFGLDISIDNTGNFIVTGCFEGTVSFGSHTLSNNGNRLLFIAKMDSTGNWLWATQTDGSGEATVLVEEMILDDTGSAYVTGKFDGSVDFGSYNVTSNPSGDIFVAKIDSTGSWQWATQAGGDNEDYGYGITIDNAGNPYVTGKFSETSIFGSYNLTSYGWSDIFISMLDSNGNWLWVKQAGGIDSDAGYGITIDDIGNTYVTGRFQEIANFGLFSLTSNGETDIFTAKLGSDSNVVNEIVPLLDNLSNYPNPFNPTTTISFSLPEDGDVELSIYNVKGQKVRTLTNEFLVKGLHSIEWNGTNTNNKSISSGIYFYKISAGKETSMKKMLLLK